MFAPPPPLSVWQRSSLRRGLLLADQSSYVPGALVALWLVALAVIILAGFTNLVLLLFGKNFEFEHFLDLYAWYGFVVPIALIATVCLLLQLVSRALCCAVDAPFPLTALATVATAGRLAAFAGAILAWRSKMSPGEAVLLPGVIASATLVWLGLYAERKFFKILLDSAGVTGVLEEQRRTDAAQTLAQWQDEQKKTFMHRDFILWFKARYPRTSRLLGIVVLGLAIVMSAIGNGRSLVQAVVAVLVIWPVFLQLTTFPPKALLSLCRDKSIERIRS